MALLKLVRLAAITLALAGCSTALPLTSQAPQTPPALSTDAQGQTLIDFKQPNGGTTTFKLPFNQAGARKLMAFAGDVASYDVRLTDAADTTTIFTFSVSRPFSSDASALATTVLMNMLPANYNLHVTPRDVTGNALSAESGPTNFNVLQGHQTNVSINVSLFATPLTLPGGGVKADITASDGATAPNFDGNGPLGPVKESKQATTTGGWIDDEDSLTLSGTELVNSGGHQYRAFTTDASGNNPSNYSQGTLTWNGGSLQLSGTFTSVGPSPTTTNLVLQFDSGGSLKEVTVLGVHANVDPEVARNSVQWYGADNGSPITAKQYYIRGTDTSNPFELANIYIDSDGTTGLLGMNLGIDDLTPPGPPVVGGVYHFQRIF